MCRLLLFYILYDNFILFTISIIFFQFTFMFQCYRIWNEFLLLIIEYWNYYVSTFLRKNLTVLTHWRSVHTYFFFYVRYTSQVQMSPQTFCRGNNWIYVCAFDAALIFTTFMHNVYKICGTFPLFHVCCSPIVSKVSKQKSIFFSKFQENWSFRNIGAKWTKI